MGSIKTTAVGILMILGGLIQAGTAILQGTSPNWTEIGAVIIAGIGFLAAKDHKPVNLG